MAKGPGTPALKDALHRLPRRYSTVRYDGAGSARLEQSRLPTAGGIRQLEEEIQALRGRITALARDVLPTSGRPSYSRMRTGVAA